MSLPLPYVLATLRIRAPCFPQLSQIISLPFPIKYYGTYTVIITNFPVGLNFATTSTSPPERDFPFMQYFHSVVTLFFAFRESFQSKYSVQHHRSTGNHYPSLLPRGLSKYIHGCGFYPASLSKSCQTLTSSISVFFHTPHYRFRCKRSPLGFGL